MISMMSSAGVDGDRRHLSNNKSSAGIDGKYNSTAMRLVLAVLLSATYHITYNVQEPINNLSPTSSAANYTNSSSETFVPHWEIIPTIVPYMGNLTCVSQHCATAGMKCACLLCACRVLATKTIQNG